MEHAYRGRPPTELDVVLHKITALFTCWPNMEREGVPLPEMTNLIESLSHEPLARAVTADPLTDEALALATITPAMDKAFDAVMDSLRSPLRLHHEFKHKGLSVEGLHQSIRLLVKGPLTRAAIGPESTPNLVQSVDKVPDEATNAEASTRTIRPSPALPATSLSSTMGKVPDEATNAEASTRTIRLSPALPATSLPPTMGKVPNEATTAEASAGAIWPSAILPPTNLSHIMSKAPNEATNADALTGAIQTFPSLPAANPSQTMNEAPKKAANADALSETIQQLPSSELDGLIKAPSRTSIPVIVETKHPKQSETTTNAVVGPDDQTHRTKHSTQSETTATAVVEADVTLSDDEAEALLTADIVADIDPIQYSKEAKQWIDIKIEPACSQEVERGSRLTRSFNVIAPGPNIEEVAPSGLAMDREWFDDIPSGLKHVYKDMFKANLSCVEAHCIFQLAGKASQELHISTGSSFKGDQDALVISNTYYDRTKTWLLTLLTAILENKRLVQGREASLDFQATTPFALVLVPTRTLAEQAWEVLIDMLRYTGLRGVVLYGGTGLDIDYTQLRRGCDILIATPGRLIRILKHTNLLSLCNIRWLVMDEADAMLAPNFAAQLKIVQSYVPQQHNLWLFTSILRESRRKEALKMLDKDHVRIDEGDLASPQLLGLLWKYLNIR